MQIDWTTTVLGFLIIGYGIFTLIMRKKKPEFFSKLDKMKETWGEKKGNILHVFGYTILSYGQRRVA
jgi:hypothetical protein